MIYFSFGEIIVSTISFFCLGLLFGALYKSFITIYFFLKELFALPLLTYKKYNKLNISQINLRQKIKTDIISQIIDFFFVITYCAFLILFYYIFLDGVPRFFPIMFSILGYLISFKFLSPIFEKLLNKLFNFLLMTLLNLCFIVFYPIFKLVFIFKKLFTPIFVTLMKKYRQIRLKRLISVKNKKAEKFITK